MRRVCFSLFALAALLAACAPSTDVRIEVPGGLGDLEDLAGPPARQVVYSELQTLELIDAFDRVAKVVHPRYSVTRGQISFGGEPIAFTYPTWLTSGVTRFAMDPRDHEAARRLAPLIEAWTDAGLTLLSSGLSELEPMPVPPALVAAGGELYRFYEGTRRDQLLIQSRECRNDYLVSEAGRNPDFRVDATDMPDGRARLYVSVYDTRYLSLSRRAELQRELGLFLACLDVRAGPGQES